MPKQQIEIDVPDIAFEKQGAAFRTELKAAEIEGFENIAEAFADGELDTRWTATVHRAGKIAAGSPEPHLFNCTPDEIAALMVGNAEPIIERTRPFGSDTYRCRVARNGRMVRRPLFAIENPEKTVTLAPNGAAIVETSLTSMVRETNATLVALAQQMAAKQETKSFDWKEIIGVAGPAITAFGVLIGNFRDAITPAKTDVKDIIEMAKLLNGAGGEKETGPLDVLNTAIESGFIQQLIDARAAQLQGPPQQQSRRRMLNGPQKQPQPQAQTKSPQQKTPVAQQANGQADAIKILRDETLFLCRMAQRPQSDPQFWAEYLLEKYGDEFATGFANDQNAIAQLQQIAPEMVPYTAWFEDLLYVLREMMREDTVSPVRSRGSNGSMSEGPPVATDTAVGDADNTPGSNEFRADAQDTQDHAGHDTAGEA